MRYLVIGLAMVMSFAASVAAQSAMLPYTLTFSGTSTQGTINGAWGGTFAQGAYAQGRWILFSGGKLVVDGTYRCAGGCTFDGGVVYGTPTKLLLQAGTLDDTAATTETVSGSLPLDLRPPTLVP